MKVLTNKIQNEIYYGSSSTKIVLSRHDELMLKEISEDKERWTRITPNGREKYEPLFEYLEQVDKDSWRVSSGPYVGRVELNDCDLVFLPPTWLNGLTPAHLIYMLIKSIHPEPKTVYLPESSSLNQVGISDLHEPIYSYFTNELFKELNKGVYRKYERANITSSKLRGKINFLQQINLNLRGKPLFATNQEIFSDDNEVNQLLSIANKIVLENSSVAETADMARRIKRMLPNHSYRATRNTKKIKLDRRGNHFKTTLELAQLIVSGKSIHYYGEFKKTISVVINLFDLFESYISSELFSRDSNYDNKFYFQMEYPNPKNSSWGNRKAYPDLVYISDTNKLVIDTKLKRISKYGPKIEDIYQIHFYASMLGLENGILVYPTNSETEETYSFPLTYNGLKKQEIIAYGIPITLPPEKLSLEIDKLHKFLLKNP